MPPTDPPRNLWSPSTLLLGRPQLSHFPLFIEAVWLCKYFCTRDLCIITNSVTICCWLVDLPCVCFLVVFSCIWVMFRCNNVIISSTQRGRVRLTICPRKSFRTDLLSVWSVRRKEGPRTENSIVKIEILKYNCQRTHSGFWISVLQRAASWYRTT